ncbi:hypothetical protein QMK19_22275 [Streptomyces sp. H10-C2]|uniref:hypothetical protein n=1 Tax=unclassified Streptomyces TaxID=2593676 RepID=UPI0024B8CBA3|nr:MULTISPECIES: hypothetical protein [unclassified Streptomyces]MDJ0342463.1 hypothetical protein [Streptomyces sp. PH10-H1]MDJ0372318.1 hypothetical protein [Streptomyces sp. H10-C2]
MTPTVAPAAPRPAHPLVVAFKPWRKRLALIGAEFAVALVAAVGFAWWSVTIAVNPMTRVGQVSGLASLQFRLAVIALPLLAVVLWTVFRSSARVHRLTVRLVCAAVAGLATGMTAGGQVVALRGTPWPLNGQGGDNGRLEAWATQIQHGGHMTNIYPPLLPHLTAFWAEHFNASHQSAFALKQILIVCIALTGPAAYLAWRLFLRPLPALGVGLLAGVPSVVVYKPYSPLVLVVLVPLLAKLLQMLRKSPDRAYKALVWRGAALGAILAILFLVYSGWHVWSAPGIIVAVLGLFPWRSGRAGRLRGLAFLGSAVLVFLLLAGRYMVSLLSGAASTKDRFCSTLTLVDPGYFAMTPFYTRNANLPGMWPPPGELGGVGVFTALMVVGIGVALTVGLKRSAVITTVACFGSAWLVRFYFAANMERDQAVQLFPRTYQQLLYCGLALVGLAVVLTAERIRARLRTVPGLEDLGLTGNRNRYAAIGVLAATVLLSGMAASAQSDPFFPENPKNVSTMGRLAWAAHQLQKPDGSCPKYAPHGTCQAPKKLNPHSGTNDGTTLTGCEYGWRKGQ